MLNIFFLHSHPVGAQNQGSGTTQPSSLLSIVYLFIGHHHVPAHTNHTRDPAEAADATPGYGRAEGGQAANLGGEPWNKKKKNQ